MVVGGNKIMSRRTQDAVYRRVVVVVAVSNSRIQP